MNLIENSLQNDLEIPLRSWGVTSYENRPSLCQNVPTKNGSMLAKGDTVAQMLVLNVQHRDPLSKLVSNIKSKL